MIAPLSLLFDFFTPKCEKMFTYKNKSRPPKKKNLYTYITCVPTRCRRLSIFDLQARRARVRLGGSWKRNIFLTANHSFFAHILFFSVRLQEREITASWAARAASEGTAAARLTASACRPRRRATLAAGRNSRWTSHGTSRSPSVRRPFCIAESISSAIKR